MKISAFLYPIVYAAAMILPRTPYSEFSPIPSNFFGKAFHRALYYSGPLEPFANFFFLIPIFAILVAYLGQSRSVPALVICIALSASAEILQISIPGRVSSFKDFVLNSAGAVAAYLLYLINIKKWQRFKSINQARVNPSPPL